MPADDLREIALWAETITPLFEQDNMRVAASQCAKNAAKLHALAAWLEGRVVCGVEYREHTPGSGWVEARPWSPGVGCGTARKEALAALQELLDKEADSRG